MAGAAAVGGVDPLPPDSDSDEDSLASCLLEVTGRESSSRPMGGAVSHNLVHYAGTDTDTV
jgi:hypothetical protein